MMDIKKVTKRRERDSERKGYTDRNKREREMWVYGRCMTMVDSHRVKKIGIIMSVL